MASALTVSTPESNVKEFRLRSAPCATASPMRSSAGRRRCVAGVRRWRYVLSRKTGQVHFRYRDSQTGKSAVRTVGGARFLALVLQHVQPNGFRRSRNFRPPAPEQQAADCAAADRVKSGPRPDLDEAPAAVSGHLLRRAHAYRAKTDPGA